MIYMKHNSNSKRPEIVISDYQGKKIKSNWVLWVISAIVIAFLINWILPDGQQQENINSETPDIAVKEISTAIDSESENPDKHTIVETPRQVVVRYYTISLNETSFSNSQDLKDYNEGKAYYPVLVYNYDGELCKKDTTIPEDPIRCPYKRENPQEIRIRKGDSLIVHEDIDCKKLNLTSCREDFSNIKQDSRLVFILLNQTTETRFGLSPE